MRWMVDTILALLLVAVIGGLAMDRRKAHNQREDERFVQNALARMHEQVLYRGALEAEPGVEPDQRFPDVLRPKWFDTPLPVNILADSSRPWLDIAPPDDRHRHPPDPVTTGSRQAGFWYNPNRGIIRARVAPQSSKADTLALYNRVNQSDMSAIAMPGNQPIPTRRQPVSFRPTRQSNASNTVPTDARASRQATNMRNPFAVASAPAGPSKPRAYTQEKDTANRDQSRSTPRPRLGNQK